jgi:hypothetical protein
MKAEAVEILNAFGSALLTGTPETIASCMASWLQGHPVEEFVTALKEKDASIREEFRDRPIGQADAYDVDGNDCTYDDLAEDAVAFSAQMNASNFVQWACVSIQADEGEWSLGDVWCAVVCEAGQYTIGYCDVQDPD